VPVTDDEGHSPVDLLAVLGRSQVAGFLGPGAVGPQQQHAQGFTRVARRLAEASGASGPRILDLGSGGGLPGLVTAQEWPAASLVLLDANERRTAFLTIAARDLGLSDRISVICARAETAGRDPALRGAFDGVVARSFGPPGTLSECAAPFLRVGGWLVVSEPPASEGSGDPASSGGSAGPAISGKAEAAAPWVPAAEDPSTESLAGRWPAEALEQFGLVPEELVQGEFTYQVLRQATLCPERFPRRNGVPAKRPLF
jgi:16S rRNA (guanine527-N7)-methyltransferase